jgi:hypothetical protein
MSGTIGFDGRVVGEKLHLDNCRTGRGRAPMKNRVLRVPDSVWDAAARQADANDEYLSEAIRRFLERYGRGEQR